jgi:hypothetical protein
VAAWAAGKLATTWIQGPKLQESEQNVKHLLQFQLFSNGVERLYLDAPSKEALKDPDIKFYQVQLYSIILT